MVVEGGGGGGTGNVRPIRSDVLFAQSWSGPSRFLVQSPHPPSQIAQGKSILRPLPSLQFCLLPIPVKSASDPLLPSFELAHVMGEIVRFADNTGLPAPGVQLQEVQQHGTIGDFIGSSLEGIDSGFIRCVYNAKNHSGNTVTLLCEKMEGCCVTGCCPKDQFWMTGLIILLIFVLVIFCCGTLAIIICYQRTKSRQRRVEKEIYQSRMGSETGGGLYNRPTYHQQYGTTAGGGYARAAPAGQIDPNLTQTRRF